MSRATVFTKRFCISQKLESSFSEFQYLLESDKDSHRLNKFFSPQVEMYKNAVKLND